MINVPRTTSVETETDCLVVSVTKASFSNFLKVCPSLQITMTQAMKSRITENLCSQSHTIFDGIPAAVINRMGELSEIRNVEPGELLVPAGATRAELWLVVMGTVRVGRTREEQCGARGTAIEESWALGPTEVTEETRDGKRWGRLLIRVETAPILCVARDRNRMTHEQME
ncbi:unnamed protein product [Phaeothamnion confervicola]